MIKYKISELEIVIKGKRNSHLKINFYGNIIHAWTNGRKDPNTLNIKFYREGEKVAYHFVINKYGNFSHIDFSEETGTKASKVYINSLVPMHYLQGMVYRFREILEKMNRGTADEIFANEIKQWVETISTVRKKIESRMGYTLDNLLFFDL